MVDVLAKDGDRIINLLPKPIRDSRSWYDGKQCALDEGTGCVASGDPY